MTVRLVILRRSVVAFGAKVANPDNQFVIRPFGPMNESLTLVGFHGRIIWIVDQVIQLPGVLLQVIELIDLANEPDYLRELLARQFVDLLAVSHPGIVRVLDFGLVGTTMFVTTELLDGM